MTNIALFHSVLGVRPGVTVAADRLRAAGHDLRQEPPQPTFTLTLKDGTIRADVPQEQLWTNRR